MRSSSGSPGIPAPLDEPTLAALRDDFASTGDLPELAALIGNFVRSGAAQVITVGAAVEAGDWDAVRVNAHRLNGASRTLGAGLVGAAAAKLEDAATVGDELAARDALAELEAAWALSADALTETVAALDHGFATDPRSP